MLSLQAKSRQDFILASRRPLLRNDSTNSDQNETVFQEATSANVLNATPFAKADTSLINTDQTQDLKLAKSHDLSSFNGTKSMLPSGIILAHEAAANDRFVSVAVMLDTCGTTGILLYRMIDEVDAGALNFIEYRPFITNPLDDMVHGIIKKCVCLCVSVHVCCK